MKTLQATLAKAYLSWAGSGWFPRLISAFCRCSFLQCTEVCPNNNLFGGRSFICIITAIPWRVEQGVCRELPVLKTGSLQSEQDPCNESRFSLWLKPGLEPGLCLQWCYNVIFFHKMFFIQRSNLFKKFLTLFWSWLRLIKGCLISDSQPVRLLVPF